MEEFAEACEEVIERAKAVPSNKDRRFTLTRVTSGELNQIIRDVTTPTPREQSMIKNLLGKSVEQIEFDDVIGKEGSDTARS